MALYHTLLGLLEKKSMTGYQMKQIFSSSILFFWDAHISQIYKELNKMEQKGWVESEIEPQTGKPDRKVYSLTPAGKAEFLQWLQDIKKTSEESIKSEFMAKLFFASAMHSSQITFEFKRFLQQKEAELAAYEEIEKRYFSGQTQGEGSLYEYMTLLRGISCSKADIAWAQQCLYRIEKNKQA